MKNPDKVEVQEECESHHTGPRTDIANRGIKRILSVGCMNNKRFAAICVHIVLITRAKMIKLK